MGPGTPKVLLPVLGRPMLSFVLDAVRSAGFGRVILVVGRGREQILDALKGCGAESVVQPEPRGTADAVLACRGLLASDEECAVVYGDVPLMTGRTVRRLVNARRASRADVAVLTAVLEQPLGYGRIIRGDGDIVEQIIEERDASEVVRRVKEVNSGFYAFIWGRLLPVTERVRPSPVTGEYYLTDAIRGIRSEGGRVIAVLMDDPKEMLGVNTPEQYRQVTAELGRRMGEPKCE